MPRARPEVLSQALLDLAGKPGLENGCRRRERLDLDAGPLERGVERRGIGARLARSRNPLQCPLHGRLVHRGDVTVAVGGTSPSWTTSFRRS